MGYACKLGGTSSDIKMVQGNYSQSYYGSSKTINVGMEFNILVIYASPVGGMVYFYINNNPDYNPYYAVAATASGPTYAGPNFNISVYSTYFTHGKPNTISVDGTYYWIAFKI